MSFWGDGGRPFLLVHPERIFVGMVKDKNKKDKNGKYNHIAIPDAG